jgi:hypothetical protein
MPDYGQVAYEAHLRAVSKHDPRPRDVMRWTSLSDKDRAIWSDVAKAVVDADNVPVPGNRSLTTKSHESGNPRPRGNVER